MKKHIHLFIILLLVIFILNDIPIIYSNSILFPDYSYISVALYYIPTAQWNQAYIPFPALFIYVINLLTNSNPITLLSIFYVLYKYIYIFVYWLIAKQIRETKLIVLFGYWFLISTLILLQDKVLLYTVPYNIALLVLSYFYTNLILNNKFDATKKIVPIMTLISIIMALIYFVSKNYLYSISLGALLFIVFVRTFRINKLKESWPLIFASFSYPIITAPLLFISTLSYIFAKLKYNIRIVLIIFIVMVGFYNYYGNTSLINFNFAIFSYSPFIFLFINKYMPYLFIFLLFFVFMLIKRTSELIFMNLLFFFSLPIILPTEYTYRYLHFILFIIPTTVIFVFRLNYEVNRIFLIIPTIISIFVLVTTVNSIPSIDIYSDFKHYSGIGELSHAEIYLAQNILSIVESLPLHKVHSYTIYGTYIDFVRDCYIISDPYTSFFLTSITRCRTYFDPIYVIPTEYTREQLFNMKFIRVILMNISNFMYFLKHNTSDYIYLIVLSNRTAYYLKHNGCYFVFLDKSPHMYAQGNCYMSQPFNIPDQIIDPILNINFTKYVMDRRNFQVYYIVYSPSRNKQ